MKYQLYILTNFVLLLSMDKIIKTLFTDGKNNGDVTIVCTDGTFTCHSFVICNACATLERMFAYALEAKSTSISTDFTTKTMKYLISMLYDSSLGEKEEFGKVVSDYSTVVRQESLHLSFVLEYIQARDYFGIEYGVYDDIPVNISSSLLVCIISKLPELSIYAPMKERLYESLYKDIEGVDLESDIVKIAFENPSIALSVAGLYKRKVKELATVSICAVCGKKCFSIQPLCVVCARKYSM